MGSAWLGSARLGCPAAGGHCSPVVTHCAKRNATAVFVAQLSPPLTAVHRPQRNALYARGATYCSQRSIRTAQGVTDSTVSQDAPEPVAYTLLPLWTLLPEPKGSNFLKAVLAYMQALLPMGRQALLSAAAALILRVNSVESVGTAAVTHG